MCARAYECVAQIKTEYLSDGASSDWGEKVGCIRQSEPPSLQPPDFDTPSDLHRD